MIHESETFKTFRAKNIEDTGYPQHKELRDKIIELWKENPTIDFIWKTLTT